MFNLENVLDHRNVRTRLGIVRASNLNVILDTSAVKYFPDVGDIRAFILGSCGTEYNIAMTVGVMGQLERQIRKNPHIFPPSILDTLRILDPEVITEFAPPGDERVILDACQATYRDRKVRANENPDQADHIGWVDLNVIAPTLKEARNGNKSVILTDDADIEKVVRKLRSKNEYIRDNVLTVSILRYNNWLRNSQAA